MSTESTAPPIRSADTWRTALQLISVAAAIDIALHAFIVTEPAMVLIVAAVWLAVGVLWTRRGGKGGPIVIAILATLEILGTLLFPEEFTGGESVAAWILIVHVVVMAAALVAAAMTLVRSQGPS